MKIRLLQVGRPRDRELEKAHDRHADRIGRLRATYDWVAVPETPAGGSYSDAHVLEREAAALLGRHDGIGRLVALDRSGSMIDSTEVAARLPDWAARQLTVVLGGPLGLGPALLDRADFRWSLSPLTLPHELARVVVVEQLYRALTILRGLPYHK